MKQRILALVLTLTGAQPLIAAPFTDAGTLNTGGDGIAFAKFDQSGVTVDLALGNIHAGNETTVPASAQPGVFANADDGTFPDTTTITDPGRISALHPFVPGTGVISQDPRDLLVGYQTVNAKDVVTGSAFGVLENNGDGSFAAPAQFFSTRAGRRAEVAMADLDGDGDQDAAVTVHNRNGATWIYENDGDSTSASFRQRAVIDSGNSRTVDLALRDLDGDGYPDLIEANAAGTRKGIAIWKNDNSATNTPWTFSGPPQVLTHPGSSPAVTGIDITGSLDGNISADFAIVASYAGSGQPGIRFWTGPDPSNLSIDSQNLYACPSDGADTRVVDLADVDADGDQDILGGTNCNDDELVVFFNDGNNQFNSAERMDVHPGNAAPVVLASWVGLDLDSSQDLVMGFDDNSAHVLLNTGSSSTGDSGGSSGGGGGGGGSIPPLLMLAGLLLGLSRARARDRRP